MPRTRRNRATRRSAVWIPAAGLPIPGFAAAECVEAIGNEIDRAVRWKNGSDVNSLAGKTVRLRFVLRDAGLFAIQFSEK